MRRPLLALVLLVAAVAAALFAAGQACEDDDEGESTPTPSGVTPTPDIISEATTESDGLRLTVMVDEETYEPGDEVRASAVLENNRGDDVDFDEGTADAPGFRLDIVSELAGDQPMDQGDDPSEQRGGLSAGDEVETEGTWDQQLDIPQDAVQAPPGRYSVRATVAVSVPDLEQPVVMQVAATFRVEGSEAVLTPLEVLALAVQSEELKAWAEGRGRNVVCPYSPTGRFYQGIFESGQSVETFDFLYESQQLNQLPICGITTEGEVWRLNFFAPMGPAPNRFNMLFDLNDGALLGTEEVTPGPSPSASPAP